MSTLTHRLARLDDLELLRALLERAIAGLQTAFLSTEQIRVSHQVMGLDTQLIVDQTYFVVEDDGRIAGCGGWSCRATLYGGDDSIVAREPTLLDPVTDAAKIRAMYTDPAFARRGIGRLVLELCEAAARRAGFGSAELMATLAGEPLYRAAGYQPEEAVESRPIDGIRVPLLRMSKRL